MDQYLPQRQNHSAAFVPKSHLPQTKAQTTSLSKTPSKELLPGQSYDISKREDYALKLKQKGLLQSFCYLATDPKIINLSNGDYRVFMVVSIYSREKQKAEFHKTSQYVSKYQEKLFNFLMQRKKGDAASIEYHVQDNGYLDIKNHFYRKTK